MKEEIEGNVVKTSRLTEASSSNLKEKMATNLEKKDEQIMLLEAKLDDLEQYTRKFNIDICGIPKDEEEDLEDAISNYQNA